MTHHHRRKLRPTLISDLARIIHPSSSRFKAVAMLYAYFDESGTHDQSDLIMIFGLISTAENWQALETDWRQLLSNVRLDYFHATQCDAGDGIFRSLQREIRDDLFKNLTNIIIKHVPSAVHAVIFRDDWNAEPGMARHFRNPYHFCFESCMHRISTWSQKNAGGEPVALIFANQDEYKTRANELYQGYTTNSRWSKELGTLTFANAAQVPALQAADLIAFECFKFVIAQWKQPELPARPAMQAMLDSKSRFKISGEPYTPELISRIVQFQDNQLQLQEMMRVGRTLNLPPIGGRRRL